MMRLTWATVVAFLIAATTYAQQAAPPVAPNAGQPFTPLNAQAQEQLQQLLQNWEKHSKGTKTLECKFTRWHYDNLAAPAGIHANRADGVLKYASPDKGLFRVDRMVFFRGMEAGKPKFAQQAGEFGEHWVCNGTQLIEFDRAKEECRVQDIPAHLQGQKIFNSPLPFVFNLDAIQIQQRYWLRQVAAPGNQSNIVVIEAWPKRQEDRAQYKLVQIAMDANTFAPHALIMYAPNFNQKTAPRKDHYEFAEVKRNKLAAGFQNFLRNFIPAKPPATWKILRDTFNPPGQPAIRQATAPDTRK
jgi:TIGR03009 family protein